ncbi:MAG: hypothetical protein HY084_12040 [Gemmatimonadetes bacterium]|nr:hypothetical protein [Gemmatimonadota bacterium]
MLDVLEAAGLVAYVGRGRSRQVQLHRSHPFAGTLAQLFQAEASRWLEIQRRLREITAGAGAALTSAWIEGPVAAEQDRFTDPLTLTVLAETSLPVDVQLTLRNGCNNVQFAQHLIIALRTLQRADLLRLAPTRRRALEHIVLLHGPAPLDLLVANTLTPTPPGLGDRAHSFSSGQRPRQIADAIAAKLLREPELIDRARVFIDRRLAVAGDTERLVLTEWQGLLASLTVGQLATLLREESERADELRQSLPFVGALTDAERQTLIEGRAADPSPAAHTEVRRATKRSGRTRQVKSGPNP